MSNDFDPSGNIINRLLLSPAINVMLLTETINNNNPTFKISDTTKYVSISSTLLEFSNGINIIDASNSIIGTNNLSLTSSFGDINITSSSGSITLDSSQTDINGGLVNITATSTSANMSGQSIDINSSTGSIKLTSNNDNIGLDASTDINLLSNVGDINLTSTGGSINMYNTLYLKDNNSPSWDTYFNTGGFRFDIPDLNTLVVLDAEGGATLYLESSNGSASIQPSSIVINSSVGGTASITLNGAGGVNTSNSIIGTNNLSLTSSFGDINLTTPPTGKTYINYSTPNIGDGELVCASISYVNDINITSSSGYLYLKSPFDINLTSTTGKINANSDIVMKDATEPTWNTTLETGGLSFDIGGTYKVIIDAEGGAVINTIYDNGTNTLYSSLSPSQIQLDDGITINTITQNSMTIAEGDLTLSSTEKGIVINGGSGDAGNNDITLTTQNSTLVGNIVLNSAGIINLNASYSVVSTGAGNSTTIYPTSIVIDDTISPTPTQTTIANNLCLIDNYHRDYQVKSQYASLSGSTSCYIQNGVSARDKGIGYTISGGSGNFKVYHEIKPFFLPYDSCKYRMNISVCLDNFGGGNQDKENQFYFELYDPNAGSVVEGFVFNNTFPYSTAIGIPKYNGNSVMNFSYVDYFDLTPFPSLVNGEIWFRFYGAGNGTSGQLRYFVSFDRIEL
jgi:hypothetical protein